MYNTEYQYCGPDGQVAVSNLNVPSKIKNLLPQLEGKQKIIDHQLRAK
jgi:hypothetical protein